MLGPAPDRSALAQFDDLSALLQREYLRPHEELALTQQDDPDAIEWRKRIDLELEALTYQEFLAQLSPDYDYDPAVIPGFRNLAENSAPFIQYLNTYFFFGVRLAAGRWRFSNDPERSACGERILVESDCNKPFAGLPAPPMWTGDWDNAAVATDFRFALDADKDAAVQNGLRFLDSGHARADDFELWLRRLCFKDDDSALYFNQVRRGILAWARRRFCFYTGLEKHNHDKERWVADWLRNPWKEGNWTVNNPLAARCALVDFYWLAKLLRADVSAEGVVTYADHSWLYLIAEHWFTKGSGSEISVATEQLRTDGKKEILRCEEVLRGAFGYACDLIQNAVEIAGACDDQQFNPQDYGSPSDLIKKWRAVEDAEVDEIHAQRKERLMRSVPGGICAQPLINRLYQTRGWSRRIYTGEAVDNLVGLALSGGGIRSATFNLGVLQALQEIDLLRYVDYVSTVSGGGYAGAWLVGNVRRTRYWLSRRTSWDTSVEHLRKYSNYLAPHNGVLSPDSWSMWLTFIRNALLIQLTGFVWLACILTAVLDLEPAFIHPGTVNQSGWARVVHVLSVGIIAVTLIVSLWTPRAKKKKKGLLGAILGAILRFENPLAIVAALGAWIGSFTVASILWKVAKQNPETVNAYSSTLIYMFGRWKHLLEWRAPLLFFWLGMASLQWVRLGRSDASGGGSTALRTVIMNILVSAAAAIVVTAVCFLSLCGVLRVYGLVFDICTIVHWALTTERADWLAFAVGPILTMAANTATIIVFIGMLGRSAPGWTREWWVRYGAWIGLFVAASTILTVIAVFAPWAVIHIGDLPWKSVKIPALATWLGSTLTGLLAGQSSKTGQGEQKSKILERVARAGSLIFIIGAFSLASTLIFTVLRNALAASAGVYSVSLQQIVNAEWAIRYGVHLDVRAMRAIPILLLVLGAVLSTRLDLNTFGLNQFYRNRLVRCYLGATRWQPGKRHPHPFTAFDDDDDLDMADLRVDASHSDDSDRALEPKAMKDYFCNERFRGPFPIVNCTLNLGGSSDLSVHTRQSASFSVTPLFCGADRKKVGYAPTPSTEGQTGYSGGLTLGQAIAVSGAAASPNMGYNTSPLVSIMMTLFNVRLGWWFPNPAGSRWSEIGPPSGFYLLNELFGLANEGSGFINASDGGHFENLGVYELIRRRARVIIVGDAECDETLTFSSLGNLVRICQTDFGARIEIDVTSIRMPDAKATSLSHCAVGRITYSNGTRGYLIYLKASITGDEDIGVAQYRSAHGSFPHESTANQFYSEDQFEAYRRLGRHIAERTFRDADDERGNPYGIASKLFDIWAPAGFTMQEFLAHAAEFDRVFDRFRTDSNLIDLFQELSGHPGVSSAVTPYELCACTELLQMMENVYLDLRLDDFWKHPDNRGWAMFFQTCARSPKFRESWNRTRSTFGIRFEYFCNHRLGLKRDRPVMRV